MENISDFKQGMRVMMREEGDSGIWIRGTVTHVQAEGVEISWDDCAGMCTIIAAIDIWMIQAIPE